MLDLTKLYDRKPKPERVYDVVIAGGGPAGIGAALSAAMNGGAVLLLEARSQFGGTATAGMWMNFNWLFRDNNNSTRGGVSRLLVDEIQKWGTAASCPGRRSDTVLNDGGNLDIHPEYLKKALFDLFERYGIDYSLYAPVVGVTKQGSAVTAITVQAKEGKQVYRGKIFIDATGDGDVALLAGCEMEDSNPTGVWRAPITLLFAICNVDTERFYKWYKAERILLDGVEFPNIRRAMEYADSTLGYAVPLGFSVDIGTVPGVININYNTTRDMFFDGTKSYDLTCVEYMGILQATELLRLAADRAIPGLEKASLMRTGGYAAVRETRRLVGEYVFTEEDLLQGTAFDDAVASKYGGRDPMGDTYPNVNIKQGAKYPYRSMLPREVDGLLVAGRCGSASFQGHYGGKSMGNMLVIGQAAGIAAVLCAKDEIRPRELEARRVQAVLEEMGVIL